MKNKSYSVSSARRPGRLARWGVVIGAATAAALAIAAEVRTSTLQAALLGKLARDLHYEVQAGPSDSIRFPGPGPHDLRLGYSQLPRLVRQLGPQGYAVTAQARMSPGLMGLSQHGLFDIYPEKDQAGLELRDCRREPLMQARFPQRVYDRFESAPRLLVDALLFIENRELLDDQHPSRNPAVEWDRLGKAAVEWARQVVDRDRNVPGGSTLATQIEKYRHSPEGRTDSVGAKLRQMATASLRAYHAGDNTLAWRRQIVQKYLNTVPLAARAGFGEINGLGDGLWAWYGRDFDELNDLLRTHDDDLAAPAPAGPVQQSLAFRHARIPLQALAFKQALSLMVAQRRPSYYLGEGTAALSDLTDSHLRLLADAGVISPVLRDAALAVKLAPLERAPAQPRFSFVERKATNAVRNRLSELLGVPRSYDLDRLDLVAHSSMDGQAQRAVTQLLHSLKDPSVAHAAGLYGERLLREKDDPSRLSVSFTLFERGEHANVLRVQADNHDQPFDLNEGAWLDLGSTAKLRTLVTYLEIVAGLHERWNTLTPPELAAHLALPGRDPLGRWALEHLARATDRGLTPMLDAAMQRSYATSPHEAFFTGGGVHRFVNFDETGLPARMSVREAFKHSANLPFVRLMRDVVRHHIFEGNAGATFASTAATPETAAVPSAAQARAEAELRRLQALERFVERESREFVARFYRKHQAAAALPQGPAQPAGRLHPLERWTLEHLRSHPRASLEDTLAASRDARREAYAWLFARTNKRAQDLRIAHQQELEAFAHIQRAWQRLGYPFESLTPSYATALGASGDRPAALAELMGIIANEGMRRPVMRLAALEFARHTPYETRLDYQAPAAHRVLPAEVARTVRRSLGDVVQDGTARRVSQSWKLDNGRVVPIGGKTGTGDHRFDVTGPGGRLISSRVVNRTATFAFVIGERYFGTVMAYVHEPYAADYKFTSALPVQLLKALTPTLVPLLEHDACGSDSPVPLPDELSAQAAPPALPDAPGSPGAALQPVSLPAVPAGGSVTSPAITSPSVSSQARTSRMPASLSPHDGHGATVRVR
jgi:membrane peptidoglycan carboxypeptidase